MRYLRTAFTIRSLNHAAAIQELSQHTFGISCVVINFISQEKALNTDHRPLVWIISVKCSTQSKKKKKIASRKRSIVQIQTDGRRRFKISVMDAPLFLNYGIFYAVSTYDIYGKQTRCLGDTRRYLTRLKTSVMANSGEVHFLFVFVHLFMSVQNSSQKIIS